MPLRPPQRHGRRPPARPRARSSATSAKSRTCRSRSRGRRISSPPPTAAPRRSLRAELAKARPGYGFLGEEGGRHEGTDKTHTWIVDPLDGTTNFLHGIPQFAISIALEREGTIVAGVIYNPVIDELFTAERGKGAFLNDRRLRVAARKRLADAVIACGAAASRPRRPRRWSARSSRAVQDKVAGLRRFGAAALDLACVAAGRLDGYWERNLSPWDMAAGMLLVREAGGFVTDLDGGDGMFAKGDIVAGNETIHRRIADALLQGRKPARPDSAPFDLQSPALHASQPATSCAFACLSPRLWHIASQTWRDRPTWRETSIRSNFPRPGSSWSGCWCS